MSLIGKNVTDNSYMDSKASRIHRKETIRKKVQARSLSFYSYNKFSVLECQDITENDERSIAVTNEQNETTLPAKPMITKNKKKKKKEKTYF